MTGTLWCCVVGQTGTNFLKIHGAFSFWEEYGDKRFIWNAGIYGAEQSFSTFYSHDTDENNGFASQPQESEIQACGIKKKWYTKSNILMFKWNEDTHTCITHFCMSLCLALWHLLWLSYQELVRMISQIRIFIRFVRYSPNWENLVSCTVMSAQKNRAL